MMGNYEAGSHSGLYTRSLRSLVRPRVNSATLCAPRRFAALRLDSLVRFASFGLRLLTSATHCRPPLCRTAFPPIPHGMFIVLIRGGLSHYAGPPPRVTISERPRLGLGWAPHPRLAWVYPHARSCPPPLSQHFATIPRSRSAPWKRRVALAGRAYLGGSSAAQVGAVGIVSSTSLRLPHPPFFCSIDPRLR